MDHKDRYIPQESIRRMPPMTPRRPEMALATVQPDMVKAIAGGAN